MLKDYPQARVERIFRISREVAAQSMARIWGGITWPQAQTGETRDIVVLHNSKYLYPNKEG
jgi:hypothetical protein